MTRQDLEAMGDKDLLSDYDARALKSQTWRVAELARRLRERRKLIGRVKVLESMVAEGLDLLSESTKLLGEASTIISQGVVP